MEPFLGAYGGAVMSASLEIPFAEQYKKHNPWTLLLTSSFSSDGEVSGMRGHAGTNPTAWPNMADFEYEQEMSK